MTLSHVATIAAVTFVLTAIIGRCICDFWRIGCCCCCVEKVNQDDQVDLVKDGYCKIHDKSLNIV